MAAKHCCRRGFLLLLFNFISTAALEKRFSDFKRCADEECSMLLCRGKAVKDFSGPDCRFLSFKKSETVYVYYKLSGRRADVWAGSVGSNFGYFPKDLLAVNHLYTDKEVEVPAEETDFVCFDTGFDKFDNYDIDLLLDSSHQGNEGKTDQIPEADSAQKETQQQETLQETQQNNSEEVTESEKPAERDDNLQDQSASLHVPHDTLTESPPTDTAESTTVVSPDEDEIDRVLGTVSDSSETKDTPAISEVVPEPTEHEPVSISEEVQIPDVKTTFGTTFDAVATDDEITTKVTPNEEEDSEDEGYYPEDDNDVVPEIPLLTSAEETVNTPSSDSVKPTESQPAAQNDESKAEEGNMWTSIGDVMFSVVTGGERTPDVSLEEEDDEDQEDESTAQHPLVSEEVKAEAQPEESPKPPEIAEPDIQDPPQSNSMQPNINDAEKLLFVNDGENDREVVRHEQALDDPVEPTDEAEDQTEERVPSVDPVLEKYVSGSSEIEKPDINATEPTEEKTQEDSVDDSEVLDSNVNIQNSRMAAQQDVDQTVTEQAVDTSKSEGEQEEQSLLSGIKHDESIVGTSLPNNIQAQLASDLESNGSVEQPHAAEAEEESDDQKEELLEDENALSFSQSDAAAEDSPETAQPSSPEPEYSDSVMRLSLLRDHLSQESMQRAQKLLGLQNLYQIEAMYNDMDAELRAARLSDATTTHDIESALEAILEVSENAILDHVENILDRRSTKHNFGQQTDSSSIDEETQILDEFQELAFSLRQKYSTTNDSTPLAAGEALDSTKDEPELSASVDIPPIVQDKPDDISVTESEDMLTVKDLEQPGEVEEDQITMDEGPAQPDINVEEDGGHFNKNKDDRPPFSTSDEMQKVPQDSLENPLDMGLGVEVDHSTSGPVDSMEPVPEISQEEEGDSVGLFLSGIVYTGCILSMMKNKTTEWTIVMISLLPDEWKPGETLFGCPWQAVAVTALVGVVTFTLFFWRTVLSVKKREYLVDEKKLQAQIEALKKEKTDALAKLQEIEKQSEQLKEHQKQSKDTISSTMKRMESLKSKVSEAETLSEQMMEEREKIAKLLEEERANYHRNEARIEKLEESNKKLQLSRKKVQEALAKTTVLLDEAKIREDARNVQHKCREKEFAALKEENKTFKASIKGWEDKHKELTEQIKVYQKSQKDLEDSVVLKDHNVEVLSDLLSDLDACDSQKGDTKVLENGEVEPDKRTDIKNRIRQMMDVTRVQTTLSVVEEERDRFMAKLLNEEKARKTLEEQHQELEHAIATLKGEKSHVENQFKILQQKNEIMVEMYQQKENALQQKLTKEELERRSKENLLSEVGGKAVEAEEQVKVLRQRINEMEEQMKKTEEVYKEQIKEQENKTHSNWVNARNAERALNQEKLESSKLREKLAVLTSQLNERRAPLFRPNSGQPAGPHQGDSYGPSPVSGGAPSPPLMIEGPRRPPSAPVGRRIDPYGPRPPSDPHGRYAENKHISGMDMVGPRSSSPANLDGSGPGSFLASPIRDSPGSMAQGPPPGHGPHDPLLPGPHIRLPPPGPYRPPRPGPYHLPPGPPPNVPPPLHGPPLPANGYPGMPPPGPMGGEFGPRPANGHTFLPRPGPGHPMDIRGPSQPHFRPPPPHHFGPMPPSHDARGPLGPRPPVPPDARFHGGPHMDLPPGPPPHPPLQNSAGAHSGPGQQEAPQDSARPAVAKP
ncbi:transport and Golgi organization protein 1 homolog isoform X2 [Salarias fasciatus]|uniref:transport and Golgi organization protein 1 homolog isoform X2 n=1 Tax=Salarias fasciatus TaxID=181472 RepID=UPI0011767F66|nr:transport and Golgi organization protein 1 homolog isoform X2 [Salarias fasciatus]